MLNSSPQQDPFRPRQAGGPKWRRYPTQLLTQAVLAGCTWLLAGGAATASEVDVYPNKPITLVVPFPPGGGVDPIARLLSEKLGKILGQPIVVVNRPGAGGTIGAGLVARAEGDGYTLMVTANTLPMTPHVLPKNISNTFDVNRDFTPLAMISSTPMVLLAHPSLNVHSATELAALAKKTPTLAYATGGNGSPMHIAGELFNKSAGISLLHSPYRGVGPALTDALGGQVKVIYLGYGGAKPYIDSGRLIPLATVEQKRSPLIATLPTMAEQGYPDVYVDIWFGVYGPKGMSSQLADKLNRDINTILRDPESIEHFRQRGESIVGGPREVLVKATRDDYERYGAIVKKLNIQAD